ncbi:unnamed protein product [Ophioblennius macclurei]
MESVTSDYYSDTDYSDPPDTFCRLDPDPAEVTAQTYVYSIICALGLIGNVLVVVTYVFYKRTKTMTDVYLFNVAAADLIFVASLPFIIYNERRDWAMGRVACKVLRSAYSVNLYSGMLLLACISGDRYVAIVRARRTFGARSRALVYSRLVCAAVWVFAVALTLPTFIYTERFEEQDLGGDGAVTVACEMSFSREETAKLMKILVPSCQMAVGFLLPLCVMAFCYSSIARTLLRAQSSQRHKAIRVVLAVVAVFVVCHLPYNAALLLHTLSLFTLRGCEAERLKLRVLAICRSVAFLHCCLNPVLYAFVGVKFRSHFRQIVVDIWCIGKRYLSSARGSASRSSSASRGTSDVCVSGFKSSEGSNMSSFSA